MTIGLTIPGVPTVHPRETWEQDGYRITDFTRLPTGYRPANVTRGVAHYTAAMNLPDGDPGENLTTNVIDRLRASQRDYLANRTGGGYTRKSDGRYFPGYHLGYSFMIDYLGGVWELRGFDYLPAATNQHNEYTIALLFYVDWQDKATELAWESARAITREARRRSGQGAKFNPQIIDHGSLYLTTGVGTPTRCSGDGIRSQLITHGNINITPQEPNMVKFFCIDRVGAEPQPSPVWMTTDDRIATRVPGYMAHIIGSNPIHVVTSAQASKQYIFVNAFEFVPAAN